MDFQSSSTLEIKSLYICNCGSECFSANLQAISKSFLFPLRLSCVSANVVRSRRRRVLAFSLLIVCTPDNSQSKIYARKVDISPSKGPDLRSFFHVRCQKGANPALKDKIVKLFYIDSIFIFSKMSDNFNEFIPQGNPCVFPAGLCLT